MEFASVLFIELFLPVLLILYYLPGLFIKTPQTRTRVRNILLLAASLLFYAVGGLKQLGLFIGTIAFNYIFGILIERTAGEGGDSGVDGKKRAKAVCALGIVVNAAVLALFKYFTLAGMLIVRVRESGSFFRAVYILGNQPAAGVYNLAMPLAISFTTFQSIAYLADVYQRKVHASREPLTFALFLSLFCQLVQGPIMRYGELAPQLRERTVDLEQFRLGLRRFCYGMGKKVLIANTVAAAANKIWGAEKIPDLGSGIAWLGLVLFTLQIYYDFSGYTDMAIGIGGMLGFRISENFDYPYTSLSIQEFWRRWHITLSSWFRDYIYIPLGGSRVPLGRICFNLLVVFFVTGIWHGASLNFILWGLLFALFSVLERLFLGKLLKKNPVKPVNWLYTLFVVMMGWVLFRAPSLAAAVEYFGQLFAFKASSQGYTVLSYLNFEVMAAMLFGILLCGFVQRPLKKVKEKLQDKPVFLIVDTVLQLAILAWSLVLLVAGSYNPSIYGNF
ncbi:MAG: MBOAT family protein [Clostridia bacterium]|nr:MBOAT family protein [Clostridia bacterium]